ncbi:hypothetical protein HYC85_003423 [Camellia sinensis]|uniref:Uncharacterized protein n=1 Tax=Camellia sinensis TaxID=4442 RepID=A0A7J7ICU4_CAMSI|nr:hypothetical protein HYC85_003423 [Camellia sinensis]
MKSATDQADLFLLLDAFIKLNRMIQRLDAAATMEENVTHNTNLVELIETDIPAVLVDVDRCLAKYDFDINLYYASLKMAGIAVQAERYELISRAEQYSFAIRQILQCVKGELLKVIGISDQDAEIVTKDLADLPEIRSIFEVVISVCVSQCRSISEVQTHIAEQIHRLVVTEISLPLDEALKPYKFLLFLHCDDEKTDLHDLKIPEHGSVVLTSRTINIYQIMPVDLNIKTEDLLLPWMLFWNNVNNIPASIIELMALHLIKACHNHLLAVILLARALKSVTDVGVWKLTFLEFHLPIFPLRWKVQVKSWFSIVGKHCIKHLCTSVTRNIELKISSLVSCWIENDLIKTETAGKHVLKDLIRSFLLEKVNKGYVRMREETRDVLLKHLFHIPLQEIRVLTTFI